MPANANTPSIMKNGMISQKKDHGSTTATATTSSSLTPRTILIGVVILSLTYNMLVTIHWAHQEATIQTEATVVDDTMLTTFPASAFLPKRGTGGGVRLRGVGHPDGTNDTQDTGHEDLTTRQARHHVQKEFAWNAAIQEARTILTPIFHKIEKHHNTNKKKKNTTTTVKTKKSNDAQQHHDRTLLYASASCLVPDTRHTQHVVRTLLEQEEDPSNNNNKNTTVVLPFPVLNMGMPKMGSTSLYRYFECLGVHTTHFHLTTQYPLPNTKMKNPEQQQTTNRPHPEYEGICMRDAARLGLPPLHTCLDPIPDAIMQMDVEFPFGSIGGPMLQAQIGPAHRHRDECYFPQLSLLEELHAERPDSTFLIQFRPILDWIRSLRGWDDLLPRLAHCALPNLPYGRPQLSQREEDTTRSEDAIPTTIDDVETSMVEFFCSHVIHLRNFVQQHPTHALIELDLYDTPTSDYVLNTIFASQQQHKGTHNKNQCGMEHANKSASNNTTIATTPTLTNKNKKNNTNNTKNNNHNNNMDEDEDKKLKENRKKNKKKQSKIRVVSPPPHQNNTTYDSRWLVVSRKRKVAVTIIPKVMCSTIRQAFNGERLENCKGIAEAAAASAAVSAASTTNITTTIAVKNVLVNPTTYNHSSTTSGRKLKSKIPVSSNQQQQQQTQKKKGKKEKERKKNIKTINNTSLQQDTMIGNTPNYKTNKLYRCAEARMNPSLTVNRTNYLVEQNYTTVLVLRDPFERALSAYTNSDWNQMIYIDGSNCSDAKSCTFEEWVDALQLYLLRIQRRIMNQELKQQRQRQQRRRLLIPMMNTQTKTTNKHRTTRTATNDKKFKLSSFQKQKMKFNMTNEHFLSQYEIAQFQQIRYDYIFRMSSTEDLNFFFQQVLGFEDGVPTKRSNTSTINRSKNKDSSTTKVSSPSSLMSNNITNNKQQHNYNKDDSDANNAKLQLYESIPVKTMKKLAKLYANDLKLWKQILDRSDDNDDDKNDNNDHQQRTLFDYYVRDPKHQNNSNKGKVSLLDKYLRENQYVDVRIPPPIRHNTQHITTIKEGQ